MADIIYETWDGFKQAIDRYTGLDYESRRRFLFRGHANAEWDLVATLDRHKVFNDADTRNTFQDELLSAFQVECGHLFDPAWTDVDGLPEAVARHAGLPTRLIDFTQSPYIASYFAFWGAVCLPPSETPEHVAIWTLDRGHKSFAEYEGIALLDEFIPARAERGWAQRSILLQVLNNDRSINNRLGEALAKFVLPISEADRALADLDEMNINRRTMFPGTDGAASTVARRIMGVNA